MQSIFIARHKNVHFATLIDIEVTLVCDLLWRPLLSESSKKNSNKEAETAENMKLWLKTNTQFNWFCVLIMKLCYIGFVLLIQLYLTKQEDENEFYHNHFAVEIQDGSRETAEKVAQRHGFTNLGHILENHYLFEHPHIHKR